MICNMSKGKLWYVVVLTSVSFCYDRHMRIFILFTLFLFSVILYHPSFIYAQTPELAPDTFYKAKILEIMEQGEEHAFGLTSPYQKVRIRILDGNLKNSLLTIEHGKGYT